MAVDATTKLQPYDLLIGGENVPAASGETFDTVSPTTNEAVGRMARAGVEDVDRAVAAARKAFDEGPWPRMTPLERSRIMHKIATILRERLPEIAVMETTNCGKISVESYDDANSSASCFEYYAGVATQLWGAQIPMNGPLLVNYPTVNPPEAIFGGYEQSGLGRELSRHTVDLYTQTKNVVVSVNPPAFDWYARWPEAPKT